MFKSYFSLEQIFLLGIAGLLLLLSLICFFRRKEGKAVWLLTLAGAALFSFIALDPFFHPWDERFHALVAKNLTGHMMKPTLYEELSFSLNPMAWDRWHIWLHKQPLFLWQSAISFKLFGISPFAFRLPSILLSALAIPAIYRSGKLIWNARAGYFSAIIFMTTSWLMELISGDAQLDSNDLTFVAYITLSIWAMIEYQYSGKLRYALLAGLFSGGAILCKWLVGLLAFGGWGVWNIATREVNWRVLKHFGLALCTTVVVSGWWQVYIMLKYPVEAAKSYGYNTLHFKKALEGHGGDWDYHLLKSPELFGEWAVWLLIPAIILVLYNFRSRPFGWMAIAMVLVVNVFFAFAATKMPSFTFVVLGPIVLTLGIGMEIAVGWVEKKAGVLRIVPILAIMTVIFLRFDLEGFQARHTLWLESNRVFYQNMVENRALYESLELPNNTIVFNTGSHQFIDIMFYTGLESHDFIPAEEDFQRIRQEGKRAAVFCQGNCSLPGYLTDDSTTIILNYTIPGRY